MIQFSIANSRFAGPGGTLPILEDDEISRKLAMLIEGDAGDGGPRKRPQKWRLLPPTILSIACGLHAKNRKLWATEPKARSQNPLPPYRGTRLPSHPPPISRWGRFNGSHRSEIALVWLRHQQAERRPRYGSVWSSKKKLYQYRPDRIGPCIQSFATRKTDRSEKADSLSIEREVRQLLAQKISGRHDGPMALGS